MSRINVENIRHPDAASDSLQLSNTGNITAPGNLSVTGTSTLTDDLVVDTDTLFVDVSTDRVGINRTPGSQLDVQGANCNFRITSNDGNTSCNLQTIESAEVRFGPTTNSALAIYTNGVEEARFLSGGGLTFNGDTAAANALDDYEYGSWTPTLTDGYTRTYSRQKGTFVKVGRMVTVIGQLAGSTRSGSASSFAYVTLPFQADALVQCMQPQASMTTYGMQPTGKIVTAAPQWDSTTQLRFYAYAPGDNMGTYMSPSDIPASGWEFGFTITYYTDD